MYLVHDLKRNKIIFRGSMQECFDIQRSDFIRYDILYEQNTRAKAGCLRRIPPHIIQNKVEQEANPRPRRDRQAFARYRKGHTSLEQTMVCKEPDCAEVLYYLDDGFCPYCGVHQ